MKEKVEIKTLNKMVERATSEFFIMESSRKEHFSNYTDWLKHAEDTFVRTKSDIRKKINSLNSLQYIVNKLELPEKTLQYEVANSNTSNSVAVVDVPSVDYLLSDQGNAEWGSLSKRQANGIRLVLRLKIKLRKALKILKDDYEKMEIKILKRKESFKVLYEMLSEETLSKRESMNIFIKRLKTLEISFNNTNEEFSQASKIVSSFTNNIVIEVKKCMKKLEDYSMIRSKLENQMKEINKLKILLEHHELPPIMKANLTKVY